VPKPFGRVAVVIGAPLEVQGTDDETVERARQELERALRDLEARACRVLEA
jgi:lysophospholipid acyltransferase (LPLAT)-like uncharacterized protein